MLVLSRGCQTEIHIGSNITVKVLEIRKRQVKLGIEAPTGYAVRRGELLPITSRSDPAVEDILSRSQQSCIAKPPKRHL
jgi:carbon storage regulator CsrA